MKNCKCCRGGNEAEEANGKGEFSPPESSAKNSPLNSSGICDSWEWPRSWRSCPAGRFLICPNNGTACDILLKNKTNK